MTMAQSVVLPVLVFDMPRGKLRATWGPGLVPSGPKFHGSSRSTKCTKSSLPWRGIRNSVLERLSDRGPFSFP